MADEPAATPAAPEVAPQEIPAPEPARQDPPDQNLVGEAKRKQKQAEKELAQAMARLEELEDKDKSETERERKAREKAEARAAELDTKVQQLEKGGLVRAAAKDFHDPDDAVTNIDLSDIESEADAQRAVKDLAKRKPHLLKASEPPRPEIGRVLQDGQRVDPAKPNRANEEAEMLVENLKQFVQK